MAQPKPTFISNLFNQILSVFLGTPAYNLSAQLQAAAEVAQQSSSNPSEFGIDAQTDARMLLANKRMLFNFLYSIGVNDFSILDIMKPEGERMRRVLSTVVNYAKYREHKCSEWYMIVKQYEATTQKLNDEMARRTELTNKVQQLEQEAETIDEEMKELEERRTSAESELLRCRKKQTDYTDGHAEYKQRKAALTGAIQNNGFLIEETKQEIDRLRPYVIEDPETEHKVLQDLNSALAHTRDRLDKIERRSRELEISTTNLRAIRAEIDKCTRTITECQTEAQKEDEAMRKLSNSQDKHEQKRLLESGLDRDVELLERQLKTSQDKIERLGQTMERRKETAKGRMMKLNDEYSTLVAERDVADQDMKRERANIKHIEQAMAELAQQLEADIRTFESEAQKMNASVNGYLNDMERRIRA